MTGYLNTLCVSAFRHSRSEVERGQAGARLLTAASRSDGLRRATVAARCVCAQLLGIAPVTAAFSVCELDPRVNPSLRHGCGGS